MNQAQKSSDLYRHLTNTYPIVMAFACSSSSLRGLQHLRPVPASIRAASTYTPSQSSDTRGLPRRPRPSSPAFFTGRPTYHEALLSLSSTLKEAQQSLRQDYIFPLPSTLPTLQPPRASWHSAATLTTLLRTNIKTNSHREIVGLLNEINALRHVANVSGRFELVGRLDDALGMYEREERDEGVEAKEVKSKIDEFGRAYATGRRKESSARVWMIPTKDASSVLDQAKTEIEGEATIPTTQVLINHIPLATHFEKTSDRDTVLRSLRITGLLGGYNVFALVRGGGTSGQAGAIGLAMARALAILREDVKEVLTAGRCPYPSMRASLTSRRSIDARYQDGREEKDWSSKGQEGSEYLLELQHRPS